ncbi:MAG: hypothetical protein R2912_06520 [Eubacteriales bacterium]
MKGLNTDQLLGGITLAGSILSLIGFISPKGPVPPNGSRVLHFFVRLISNTYVRITIAAITIIACLVWAYISIKPIVDPPALTPDPSITIPSPSLGPNEVYLNTIPPSITNKEAFFINGWSKYTALKVDHEEYPIGIGIRVPFIKQHEYSLQRLYERIEHKEVLEYKLCRKYQELRFSYGVDDSSFNGFEKDTPSGVSRILMQYACSDEFLAEDENVLFDSGEFVYRLVKHDVTFDVSQVENLRITIFWKYDADPTQRNCLSLAIIEPTLLINLS